MGDVPSLTTAECCTETDVIKCLKVKLQLNVIFDYLLNVKHFLKRVFVSILGRVGENQVVEIWGLSNRLVWSIIGFNEASLACRNVTCVQTDCQCPSFRIFRSSQTFKLPFVCRRPLCNSTCVRVYKQQIISARDKTLIRKYLFLFIFFVPSVCYAGGFYLIGIRWETHFYGSQSRSQQPTGEVLPREEGKNYRPQKKKKLEWLGGR